MDSVQASTRTPMAATSSTRHKVVVGTDRTVAERGTAAVVNVDITTAHRAVAVVLVAQVIHTAAAVVVLTAKVENGNEVTAEVRVGIGHTVVAEIAARVKTAEITAQPQTNM